jgi:hypothetical protein
LVFSSVGLVAGVAANTAVFPASLNRTGDTETMPAVPAMQGDGRPDPVGGLAGDAVGVQEGAGLVGAFELEALVGAAQALGEPQVVEHRADVQQFGVEGQPQVPAAERAPQKDPPGVVEHQRRGDVTDHLGGLPHQGGVRDPHACDLCPRASSTSGSWCSYSRWKSESSLHRPATGQDLEAPDIIGPLHDLHDDAQRVAGP